MQPAVLSLILLAAATDDGGGTAKEPPTPGPVTAIRLSEPVAIDGVLSEAIWNNGHAVSEFTQADPIEGAAPTERMEVRVGYDESAVYVAARMYDVSPDSIIARLARRDTGPPSDEFTVYFDPLRDKRTGYWFVVNAAGVQRDGTMYNDTWDESSWDGVWQSKAKVDDQGWMVEMRIPFSQMRVQPGASQVWGVNFRRRITRKSEVDMLVYRPNDGGGFVSRFPDLIGIENVSGGQFVEVLPYVTSKGEYLQTDPGNPFNDGSKFNGDIGGDLRVGIGRNLTLNATVNPDFGQVEIDPAVVNLSDTETFFEEKRPFFVEGSNLFRFGQQGATNYWGFNFSNPTFFHSRRIGRAPQGDVPSADFDDVPIGTTILGAAKLTGRTGGFNVGTLHALTAKESAKLQTGTTRFDQEVEPMAYYGVARGQKEFNDRRQGLGMMTTLAARQFDDTSLRDYVAGHSLMTGLDGWVFLDENKVWVLSGWSGVSHVAGNESYITDLQRSSRRYYQRPDAGHVSVDTAATSLTGVMGRLYLNKEKGNLFSNSAIGFITPGFEINDMGFQSRADQVNAHIGSGYKWPKTNAWKKYSEFGGALYTTTDFDGNTTGQGIWGWTFVEWINNYSWNVNAGYALERDDTRNTRGGPVMVAPALVELSNYLDTDGKSPLFWWVDIGGHRDTEGSWAGWINPGFDIKPMTNLTLSIGPEYFRQQNKAQYVDTVEDPAITSTFGHRYVFGELDQTTLSANIRLNVSFTPNVSLQTFIQPLVSAGTYTNFKELARPNSYEFNEYGAAYDAGAEMVTPATGSPFTLEPEDFNFKSLRGNAVLRWEYMPGSTFFLVWTQKRVHENKQGRLNFNRDYNRLFDSNPDNIFLAKVSYYFNL